MSNDVILEELNQIKSLLQSINDKIDNFLGFEELDSNEQDELKQIKKEMNKGEYYKYDNLFEGIN